MNQTSTSKKVHAQFVGRELALNAFYLRFSYKHMKNGIFYFGAGGLGKTWLLQRIRDENLDDKNRIVTQIIDFFDTQNHNVRGLQSTIKQRLDNPIVFEPYDIAIKQLESAKVSSDTLSSALASMEKRVDTIFIRCCQDAILGREIVLLFDTFDHVQQLFVGRWFLKEFLPQVLDLIVVIAGRPLSVPAQIPNNVVEFNLAGLEPKHFSTFVRRKFSSVSSETIERLWIHTEGTPLIAQLIVDLIEPLREKYLEIIDNLNPDVKISQSPDLLHQLVKRFGNASLENRVIWAMAYLKRRFDKRMLKYIVEETIWLPTAKFEKVLEDISLLPYVKEYLDQQTLLLHDEIQRLISHFILPKLGLDKQIHDELFLKVINDYYDRIISEASHRSNGDSSRPNMDLVRQLRAEQLGYILDQNLEAGLNLYQSYMQSIEQDFDFEELIWGELRDHMSAIENPKGYQIAVSRGQWLRKHNLFEKAEEHYLQMRGIFPDKLKDIQESLGFMLHRQGKLGQAREIYLALRGLLKEKDYALIASVERNLGQVERRAGKWDEALEHYAKSFTAAILGNNENAMVSVYVNRGYLYSAKGDYSEGIKQCERAIELLHSIPMNGEEKSRIYAWLNLGTAYRHSGDYQSAANQYRKSLEISYLNNDNEAICDVLQNIGINEYLWGHKHRQEGAALNPVCERQREAWSQLIAAMEIAQKADWRNSIASGLNRLGKVYREIYRLQQIASDSRQNSVCIDSLVREANNYRPPFELDFKPDFLTKKDFQDGNMLEKAVRLFEISALISQEVNDFHRALESWAETARIFEELGLDQEVLLIIRRINRLKNEDYQESLFSAISGLIQADVEFKRANYEQALDKYLISLSKIAGESGYADYILADRLHDLEWRLESLEPDTVLEWAKILESGWSASGLMATRPKMRDTLERIRLEAVKRKRHRE